jgi:hexosaminidase
LFELYKVNNYNYAKHILDIETKFNTDTVRNVITLEMNVLGDIPVYYTLDGSEPTTSSTLYTAPVEFTASCTFKAKGISEKFETRTYTEEIFFNKATAKPITLIQPVHKNYTFNGAITLVDGLKGTPNYRTGRWLGFSENDFEAVIDLQEATEINRVKFDTSVDKSDWVFDIRGIKISVSDDGENYRTLLDREHPSLTDEDPNIIYNHVFDLEPTTTRFVKIKALVEHSIPAWHPAVGKPAWIFIDEIVIE